MHALQFMNELIDQQEVCLDEFMAGQREQSGKN